MTFWKLFKEYLKIKLKNFAHTRKTIKGSSCRDISPKKEEKIKKRILYIVQIDCTNSAQNGKQNEKRIKMKDSHGDVLLTKRRDFRFLKESRRTDLQPKKKLKKAAHKIYNKK